ncbi:tyrosine-type recombinase/integrase [Kistimonas asteriae]|uniref:tyrosine-type recombinase/integrase n=1 Tax=Kistimonas asteriae TaxID=517724 RepID=UPI001BABA892|nr:tyrosine-type recombinase/integrase [Kistimonas asteriae]
MHDILTTHQTHDVVPETRTGHNRLGASSDKEALSLFLRRAARRSDETLRRYTRELVRFTAFIRKELIKGYADMTVADVETYVHFIQAPWPHWRQPGIDHNNAQKVYFPNPVKPGKSTDQIITVLSSFFSYLHTTGYLQGNPVSGFDKTGEKFARGHSEPRYFFEDEWQALLDSLASYPEKTKRQQQEKARLHYVIAITYGAALRQSELAQHTCKNIRTDNQGDLTLEIHGKGRRLRTLPVNEHMLQAIIQYRRFHGLSDFARDSFPLAPQLCPYTPDAESYRSMTPRQIRKWFSQFMEYCARCSEQHDPDLANRLRGKTFHSLRHTALSHLAKVMDIEDLSIFAGHESITTTQQYYTPEKHRLKQLTRDHGLMISR